MGRCFSSLLSISALVATFAFSLGATTVTVDPGQLMTTVSGVTTYTFDNGAFPSTFTTTGTNVGVVTGSVPLQYRAPTNDSTPFAYVGPGSSITETLGAAGVGVNYFGLDWGSGDQYNSVTFTDTQGNMVTYGQGGIAIPGVTTGFSDPDAYVNFNITGNNWVSVTYLSTAAAFEFDNVATGIITASAVPEPGSLTLISAGLLVVGAGIIRRRKS